MPKERRHNVPMRRRTCLGLLAAACAPTPAAPSASIQLHVDLDVDPTREAELRAAFRQVFRPAISKQPGFLEVRLLKVRGAVAGEPPRDANYRLLIAFDSEQRRQAWVAGEDHQRAWPAIEKTLRPGRLRAVLYDVV